MQVAFNGQQLASTEAFMQEFEQSRSYEGIETFFTKEKKLLQHLYLLEKADAHQAVQEVIKDMPEFGGNSSVNTVKYYLVSLSSMMARVLESNPRIAGKAFTFNTACFMLIDSKLNDDNAVEVADELIEFYMYVLKEKKRPVLLHNTVNKVIHYIDERVESSLTVEAIAQDFKISTSYLSRIFREHTGSTLVEYINIRKVEESQYHLRFSDKKIADISNQFFFCNQSYFTRTFKKYTGQTPIGFRRGLAGEYFQFTLPEGKKKSTVGQSL
jgi:YesN/AraC family two-component response regulator